LVSGKKITKKILIIIIIGLFLTTTASGLQQSKNEKENTYQSIQPSRFEATGFFYVTEDNGIWWFIDPNGEKFYSLGMSFISVDDYYYGNIPDWVNLTQERMDTWGFNTLNGGDTHLFPTMPYIYKFKFKHLSLDDEWPHQRHPDVFDPEWQNIVKDTINAVAPTLKNDSRLIGYQTDNEMKWGPDYLDDDTLLELYINSNSTTPGKQRAIEFLQTQYENDTTEFNRAWNMNIHSFEDLNDHRELGKAGWIQRFGQAKQDIPYVDTARDGVFIHITESYNDPHRVLMPLKMAVLMANGKDVIVYMDIHAVELLVKGAKDLNFSDFESFQTCIKQLLDNKVGIYACPTCLKIAGFKPEDLLMVFKLPKRTGFLTLQKGG